MPDIQMKVVEVKPQKVATVELLCSMSEIALAMGGAFRQIMSHFAQAGIQPAGVPFALYPAMAPDANGKWCVVAGIPTESEIAGDEKVKAGELPGGKVVTATHFGPYDRLSVTYDKMLAWIKDNNLVQTGPMWEYYFTDPVSEPDQKRWRTDIYIPVKK